MQMKYLWKSGFRHKWVTMALVLQQGPENRLDVCFSSSWVQYKIFSATHLTNAFQHFSLLIPITQPIITSQLTSNSISHSPSLHLQLMRKGSALLFSTGRNILESGKAGRSSQRKMEKRWNENHRNTIRKCKTYFTPSPLCSPITTCTTILYLSNPSSGKRKTKERESNFKLCICLRAQNRTHWEQDF